MDYVCRMMYFLTCHRYLNCFSIICISLTLYKDVSGGIVVKDYIEERAPAIANYIVGENATVRQTAKKIEINKSMVYMDVTKEAFLRRLFKR